MPGTVPQLLPEELVVVSLAQIFDEVSGAQTNPALTLALHCAHWLDFLQEVSYILAKSTAAILA